MQDSGQSIPGVVVVAGCVVVTTGSFVEVVGTLAQWQHESPSETNTIPLLVQSYDLNKQVG